MRLISRYILKAHIGPFVFGFSVITFVLVMDFIFTIVDLIIGKGLDTWLVLEVFMLNLAWIVALSMPMAVLVATLMAFGRLSADNEITALRAGGVSLYRMLAPVLIASGVVASGLIYFTDVILPEANYLARGLMSDIHRARPTLAFKEGIFIDELPGYSILIDRINPRTNEVSSVTIYDMSEPGPPRIMTARRGRLDLSPDGSLISIRLFDGEFHQFDTKIPGRYLKQMFNRQTLTIRDSPRGVLRTEQGARGDREMSIAMMRARIAEWQEEIRTSRLRIQRMAATGSTLKDTGGTSRTALDPLLAHHQRAILQLKQEAQLIQTRQKQISAYLVEVHKKYAIPVACVVFVLIGAPLGMIVKRSGITIGVGVSLGFFLLYWAFLIGGEELADRGIISPFWAMWSANFLIGGAGLWLVFRFGRERTFLKKGPKFQVPSPKSKH